jgi:hypothetical protein
MAEEKIKSKKASVWVFVGIAIVVILLFAVKGNYNEINEFLNPPAPAPVVHNLTEADIQLYKFTDLSNNKSVNIEAWVINIGEKNAVNITMHVRTRSQNGSMLFEGNITLSTLVLRSNETCTGDYTIVFKSKAAVERHLYHTIEVSWDGGRHTYSKETY